MIGRSPSLSACSCALVLLVGCSLDWKKAEPRDGGPQRETDGGDDANGPDSGGRPNRPYDAGADGDSPITPDCVEDEDCGNTERFACRVSKCVEHECHATKACPGSDQCQEHQCVPFTPPERFPVGYSQTSGGGEASSATYRIRLSAGMPQPFGIASSSKYRVTLGPGAGRP